MRATWDTLRASPGTKKLQPNSAFHPALHAVQHNDLNTDGSFDTGKSMSARRVNSWVKLAAG